MRRRHTVCPLCNVPVTGVKGHMARLHGGYRYGGYRMRSTWEIRVAQYLDGQGTPWTYERHTFPLPGGRSYTPDFYVTPEDPDQQPYFIEVKGWWRPGSRAKFREFMSLYPAVSIQVWNRVEFHRRGIDRS